MLSKHTAHHFTVYTINYGSITADTARAKMKVMEPPPREYGGQWTQQKLAALDRYLRAYKTALKKAPFKLIYIDAFAGAGSIDAPRSMGRQETEKQQEEEYRDGSPLIALQHKFDQYVFIEASPQKIRTLKRRIDGKGGRGHDIKYLIGDANQKLPYILSSINWINHRAVVFLDPFATEVRWRTIQAIAETKAIDLWLLFPAMAANRMLKKDGPDSIDPKWQKKLTDLFGTDDWRKEFYSDPPQPDMFDKAQKIKDSDRIFLNMSRFITKRLKGIFARVHESPLILKNTLGTPLFLLCFAAGNPRGAPIAVEIADYIIGQESK